MSTMQRTANPPPPDEADPTDPTPDRTTTTLPPNLAAVLSIVRILLAYGRHLADTFPRRSAAPGFHLIAKAFGTSRPALILAHIRRGILRAAALERLLLARAARGRDLTLPPLRLRTPHPAAAHPPATPPELPPARKSPTLPAWRDHWLEGVSDPLDPRHLPTLEELQAAMRRRPIGRILGEIYADLGIAPSLCLGPFWDALFMAMLRLDGSPATYDVRRWQREQAFAKQQDRRPTMDLSWPPVATGPGRDDILQVLGFLIGEPPLEPPIILPPRDTPDAVRTRRPPCPPAAGARAQAATGPP